MSFIKIEQKNMSVSVWLITVFLFFTAGSFAYARLEQGVNYPVGKQFADSLTDPYEKIAVHDIGKIGLTVSNKGQFGTGFIGSGILDPATGLPAPSCEYPLGSGNEYLFAGTFWIGAIVGEDTLVSVGAGGWQMTEEMWPDVWPGGDIIHRSIYGPDAENAVSEQDFIATYTDTLTDPAYVSSDPFDGRPHLPLNVEVTQKSYAWSGPYTDDFVIIDYSIKNIGTELLEKTYLGIYVDADVQSAGEANGFLDDICGFKETVISPLGYGIEETVNLAWIADNDGLPAEGACPFGENPLTSVTGVRILRTPSDSANISFNWWISNGNASLDWGPRQDEDPFRDFGGFLGTPEGDHNKYYIMSHPEFDYDQLFSAVDQTAQGWLPPSTQATDLAEGFDTRYLLSVGPFDIAPGQTLPLAIAYVAGGNFHTECNAFDSLFNSADPQAYYDYLNFTDIGFNAIWADWVYDNPGVDTDGDDYRGEYIMEGEDTLWYKGDGVPDFNPPFRDDEFICGDASGNSSINVLDIVYIINYLYKGGPPPDPIWSANVNGDSSVNIQDVIYFVNYLYKNGPAPECVD